MSDLFILLSAAEADGVRGPTSPGAALMPMPLPDGTAFVLPGAVLDDPAHGMHHAVLATLERRALTEAEALPDPQ
ncbi:MAG: hypothetical protein AB1698_02090 [Pseudomonadota bacterium]